MSGSPAKRVPYREAAREHHDAIHYLFCENFDQPMRPGRSPRSLPGSKMTPRDTSSRDDPQAYDSGCFMRTENIKFETGGFRRSFVFFAIAPVLGLVFCSGCGQDESSDSRHSTYSVPVASARPEKQTPSATAAVWEPAPSDQSGESQGTVPIKWPKLPSPLTGDWMKEQGHHVADELAQKFPNDVYAQHVHAQVYRLSGDTEEALKIWHHCLELKKDFLPAYEEIVQILVRRGDHAQAEKMARQGLAFHPRAVSLRNLLASILLEQGRLDEVITTVLAGRALGTESPEGLFLAAQAYQRKQQHDRARDVLEEAVRLRPEFTQAHYALAVSLARLGDQAGARRHREIFQKLKERDQQANAAILRVESDEFVRRTVAGIFQQAGVIFSNHGLPERAEECWLMGAALSPKDVVCRQALVVLYQQQRRPAAGLAIVEELVGLEPRNPSHRVAEGVFYLQIQNFEKAIDSFKQALALDPKMDAAYAGLAQAYLQKKENLEEARRLAETAVQLSPQPDYFVVLAVASAELGDWEQARRNVEKALTINPSHDLARKLARFLQHGI